MRFALAGLLLAAVFAAAASAGTKPRLWLARTTPIELAGAGFPHGAAVTVILRSGTAKRTHVVRATRTGRISAPFVLPTLAACRALPVVATAKAAKTALVVLRFTSPGSSRDCAPKQPVNS